MSATVVYHPNIGHLAEQLSAFVDRIGWPVSLDTRHRRLVVRTHHDVLDALRVRADVAEPIAHKMSATLTPWPVIRDQWWWTFLTAPQPGDKVELPIRRSSLWSRTFLAGAETTDSGTGRQSSARRAAPDRVTPPPEDRSCARWSGFPLATEGVSSMSSIDPVTAETRCPSVHSGPIRPHLPKITARAVLIEQIDESRASVLHTDSVGRLAAARTRARLLVGDANPAAQLGASLALHQLAELRTSYDDLITDLQRGRRRLPLHQSPTHLGTVV
jgi:hypothetical protein